MATRMTPFTDVLPYLRTEIPAADQLLLLQQVRLAARELCLRSHRNVYEFDPISIRDGRSSYDLVSPPETEIGVVLEASMDGRLMSPWEYRLAASLDELILVSEPQDDIDNGLIVKVALVPTVDADHLDARVMADGLDFIVAGAKARLLGMSDRQWSNPQAALQSQARFLQGISRLREQVESEFAPRIQAVERREWV